MSSKPSNYIHTFTTNQHWHLPTKPWRYLLIIILVVSISFRFAHLDQKVFWWDEVINSIHSAGYSLQSTYSKIERWQNQDISVENIRQIQYPSSQSSSLDVIRVLAQKEPQSPPLYYLLLRCWTQLFGSSVTVQRSLSAFLSLLAFPSMYWLCLELFNSSLAASIGVILLAVSPFHLIFAQEVRMYGVWTVTILLSSFLLLRAIRLQRLQDWILYSASLTLSLYTFPLSLLVAIGQGIYVSSTSWFFFYREKSKTLAIKKQFRKIFSSYLTASVASLIAYIPWFFFLLQIDDTKMASWRQRTIPLADLLKSWLLQTSMIVADLNPNYIGGSGDIGIRDTFFEPLSFYPMIFVWAAILYSSYFLISNSSPSVWLFISSLILVPALALACPDLIFGGIRSTVSRYLIPCYLGIELLFVNLIYRYIESQFDREIRQKIGLFFLGIFLTIGIISSGLIVNSNSWWNKSLNSQNVPIANIINSSQQALIITPKSAWINLLSLSNSLNNNVVIRFVTKPHIEQTNSAFKNRYLFNYSEEWLNSIKKENNFKLEKVYQGSLLETPNPQVNFSLVHIEKY